jgi:hypothetical protein
MKKKVIQLCFVIIFFATSSCSKNAQTKIHSDVIECILNHPQFAQYLHSEIKGRLPVEVYGSTLPENVKGNKFTRGDEGNTSKEGIYFTNFDFTSNTASVALKYPIEGVVASFTLEKKDDVWVIIDFSIFET